MYVQPNTTIYTTFADAQKFFNQGTELSLLDEPKPLSFDELVRGDRNLVVGEPGIGKTLLLQQAKSHLDAQHRSTLLLRLKDDDALNRASTFAEDVASGSKVLLLDALDEVGSSRFPGTLRAIEDLGTQHPEVTICLSSRWVFVSRHASAFQRYRFVAISPFTRAQVRQYLLASGHPDSTIKTLFRRVLPFEHRWLVIQTPRYLSYLDEFLRQRGPEAASRMSRNDLFEYFIYSKLDREGDKLHVNKVIIKRVLEKLALTMEIYQSNTISTDELMTFFDEVRSDLKQVALSQVPLQTLYDYSLLKVGQDNVDCVEFDNTEFQEYLAAKEISRFADPSRAAFAFAADADAHEVHPSWFNALTFLVDMEPVLLGQLIEFSGLRGGVFRVVDEALMKFLCRIDPTTVAPDLRTSLFADLVSYHQRTLQWLPVVAAAAMPSLFTPSLESGLKEWVARAEREGGARRFVPLGNVATVVGFLLEAKAPLNKGYWRAKLLEFAKDTNENGVLQRHALFALSQLGDATVVDELPDLTNSEELIAREFRGMCAAVAPEHSRSIDYAVEAVKRRIFDGHRNLTAVKERTSIRRLFSALSSDASFRHGFLEHSALFADDDASLIAAVGKVMDDEIAELGKQVLLQCLDYTSGHEAEQSRFLLDLWKLLNEREPGFIPGMVDRIRSGPNARAGFFFCRSSFAAILGAEDVPAFIQAMARADEGRAVLPILAGAKATRGAAGERVFEAGRAILPEQYRAWEEGLAEAGSRPEKNREECELLQRFRAHLEPEPGKFSLGIFEFYNDNAAKLGPLLGEAERVRLAELVTGTVLKWDPLDFDFSILEERDGVGIRYRLSEGVAPFGAALRTAKLLGVDTTPSRQRIINFIPFAYGEQLGLIFELAGPISATEFGPVVSLYRERKGDLWKHQTTAFVEAVERYHIVEAAPVLKGFVTDAGCSTYVRQRALVVLESLVPDPAFLSEVFEQYNGSVVDAERELSVTANELLITQHGDATAVRWRLSVVLSRVVPFRRSTGVHSVSPTEDELTGGMSFARPLMQLRHPGYADEYLSLLDEAMAIWRKGPEFHAYAEYLWSIVYAYFDGLKGGGRYEPLRQLESRIAGMKDLDGANWLATRMVPLRRSYLQYLGKPRGISQAIARYNAARTQDAVRIATSADLHQHLRHAIDTDLRRWIEGEGAYQVLLGERVFKARRQEYEKLIQKTLKTQVEYILLRRGFQVDVVREPQLLDEKRTDFLVHYGFAGPVVLEVKLTSNEDVRRSDLAASRSYESMKRYMEGYGASHGIFMAIANGDPRHLPGIQQTFQGIPNVAVVTFDLAKGRPRIAPRRRRPSRTRRPGRRRARN